MISKLCVVALILVVCANALPATNNNYPQVYHTNQVLPEEPPRPYIVKYIYEPNGDGGYRFEYETSDGQFRNEQAFVRYIGEENIPILAIVGSYSYTGTDGLLYATTYTADENGYRPTGKHIVGSTPPAGTGNSNSPNFL